MKFLSYVLRNARRNPVRSTLTVASTAMSLFLVMILLSFFQINGEVAGSTRAYNRILSLNAQGFGGELPIVRVKEVAAMEGITAASPFSWFGGKYNDETMPFAQFGVDPSTIFTIYDELTVPPDQLKAFVDDKAGCVIGRKLADERKIKVGDPLPLQGDLYPVDLKLVVRAVYDGPKNRDLRMCMFNWNYLDEALKQSSQAGTAGNAGAIVARCKSAQLMTPLCKKIDEIYLNSDNATRTQTEEAFSKFFMEMLGDLKGIMTWVGVAVGFSILLVSANALAMALRERTTEVAVLKAIGFGKQLVLFLVLAEAMIVSGVGGALGSIGCKLLFDAFDLSRFTGGILPFFYVPWVTALAGFAGSLAIGFLSGLIPALSSASASVIDGLRKVV